MSKSLSWAAAALLALAGCSGQDQNNSPADNVATPSEGAKITNENPSSPTIDVPNTPRNEAEIAKEKEAHEGSSSTAAPTEPATIEPSKKDEGAETPAVTPSPTEPTPDAKPEEATKPE